MPQATNKWLHVELPLTDYMEVWDTQLQLAAARADGRIDTDIVLSVEHPPVFTIGRRGSLENLKVTEDFLKQAGIPVVNVERGGDVTFHGPGQLVVYPIINLENANLKLDTYLDSLEEVMLRTTAVSGVPAGRNSLNRGIWVDDKKLGSLGITIRRGITFHGLSLNVNISLEPFEWINPCGLHGIKMTSLECELSRQLSMKKVRNDLMSNIETVFGIRLVNASLSDLRTRVEEPESLASPEQKKK